MPDFQGHWLLVGAPKAKSGGSVNACKLDINSSPRLQCSESQTKFNAKPNAIFDHQLLGVTVETAAGLSGAEQVNFWPLLLH